MARIKNRLYNGTLTLQRGGKPVATHEETTASLRGLLFLLALTDKVKDEPEPDAPRKVGHPPVRLGTVSQKARKIISDFRKVNPLAAPNYHTVAYDLRQNARTGFEREYGVTDEGLTLRISIKRKEDAGQASE